MGRALILIEALAADLLLVALVTAWAARRSGGAGRWVAPLLALVLLAVPAVVGAYGLGFLHQMGTVSTTSFAAWLAWTAALVLGSFAVIAAGRRNLDDPPRSLAVWFAAAVVLTAITTSNLDVSAKAQLAAVRVEAGARAGMHSPPRLPDAQNAAPVYRRAFAHLPPQRLTAHMGERGWTWQAYDRAAFDPADKGQKELLDASQRGLALAREAAAMPQATFDRDWTEDTSPVDLLLPELPQLKHAATLLAYDALARATRGDAAGAIEDVAAVRGIARHVRYPLLVDLITAVWIEQTAARALEDVLAVAKPAPDQLAPLTAEPGETYRDYLRRAFAMEEAWGMAAFVMLATGRAGGSADIEEQFRLDAFSLALFDSPVYRVFFLEDDLAAYRRHQRAMRDAAGKPTPEAFEAFAKEEQAIKSTRGGGVLSGLLLPASFRCLNLALEGDATRGLTRLAVAAASYKAKHGKYPEKPADLVPAFLPEVPTDPFDGRPLRMKAVDGGLVFYSVGRDRADDGGKPWDDKAQTGDVVFRLK